MTPLLLAALVVTQAVVVATWHRCLGVPGALGGAAVAGAAAIAADARALDGATDQPLSDVPAVLALAVLLALVQQLARRDGRERLTASLTATVTLTALVVLGSAYVAASRVEDGAGLGPVAATAAVLVVIGVSARRRLGRSTRYDIGVVVAAGTTAALAVLVLGAEALEVVPAVAVGAGSASLAWVAMVLVARSPGSSAWQGRALGAALPVLLAGPVAYVLGRLLTG